MSSPVSSSGSDPSSFSLPVNDGSELQLKPNETIVAQSTSTLQGSTKNIVTVNDGMYIGYQGNWTFYSNKAVDNLLGNLMAEQCLQEMQGFAQQCQSGQKEADADAYDTS